MALPASPTSASPKARDQGWQVSLWPERGHHASGGMSPAPVSPLAQLLQSKLGATALAVRGGRWTQVRNGEAPCPCVQGQRINSFLSQSLSPGLQAWGSPPRELPFLLPTHGFLGTRGFPKSGAHFTARLWWDQAWIAGPQGTYSIFLCPSSACAHAHSEPGGCSCWQVSS